MRKGVKISSCISCNKKTLLVADKDLYQYENDICATCFKEALKEYAMLDKEKFNTFLTTYIITTKLIK